MKIIKKIFSVFIIRPLDFVHKYFKTFVFLFIVILVFSFSSNTSDLDSNLAKLYIKGPIFESETFSNQINALKQYPNIKGVLLVIDSPGGTLSSSVEIADMVRELNNKIPVVAYVQGTMASGSFYAGMYANTIVANRGAAIGSIGVILNGFNLQDLMQKIGIKSQGLSAGEFKEAGTIVREWSDKEREYLKDLINKQYMMFVNDVSVARGIDKNNYKNFAEGKIFNAYDAKDLGLIDLVGTRNQAVNILQQLSHVKDIKWMQQNRFNTYMDKFINSSVNAVFDRLGANANLVLSLVKLNNEA